MESRNIFDIDPTGTEDGLDEGSKGEKDTKDESQRLAQTSGKRNTMFRGGKHSRKRARWDWVGSDGIKDFSSTHI